MLVDPILQLSIYHFFLLSLRPWNRLTRHRVNGDNVHCGEMNSSKNFPTRLHRHDLMKSIGSLTFQTTFSVGLNITSVNHRGKKSLGPDHSNLFNSGSGFINTMEYGRTE